MTDKHQSRHSTSPLLRGRFSDGRSDFAVYASTVENPDAFHVALSENLADIVLIVSGIVTGQLHATWGQDWRAFAPEWKVWVKDAAFQVFYTGHIAHSPNGSDPGTESSAGSANGKGSPGKVRFCNG